MLDDAAIGVADRAARIWESGEPGAIVPGSEAHKNAFCHTLLDPKARTRLISLPIWDIAVQTEGKARQRVLSYAKLVEDPLLRQAVELDGLEEGRHKQVLSNLVEAYGIHLSPEPEYPPPRAPEWAFMATGYSACI